MKPIKETIIQAVAIAQAKIDGNIAVQKALASAPPPINIAIAAAVAKAVDINIDKLKNGDQEMTLTIGANLYDELENEGWDMTQFIRDEYIDEQINENINECSCQSRDLFNYGCQCGYAKQNGDKNE